MKRLLLLAGLLTGCGQTPSAPPTFAAELHLGDEAAAAPIVEPVAEARETGPRPGVWVLNYAIAGHARSEELPLRFLADGSVAVEGLPAFASDEFPNRWDAAEATFEGRVRPDPLNRSAVSRDRLTLEVESPTAMRGTLAMRVNFRWIALPVTARFARPLEAGLAVTPGTITNTTKAERFD
jgi:hypothetical protein